MLTDVFAECARVLEPGGRIAVNVANLGRKPYRSLSADVTHILQDRLGLLLRGEIIWQKARGAGGNCAWGSFQSAKNPVLRDLTERVIVASKGRFDRARTTPQRKAEGLPASSTIGKDRFLDLTLDVWEFPPESATRVGHPAPFPVELPERLIELYTFEGDLVLDPFMGSGSTGVAAVQTGRHFVGYDTDAGLRRRRHRAHRPRPARTTSGSRRSAPTPSPRCSPRRSRRPAGPRPTRWSASSAAPPSTGPGPRSSPSSSCASAASATSCARSVKFPVGVEANFVGTDAAGCEWIFDVSGAFSSSRPGPRAHRHAVEGAGQGRHPAHPVPRRGAAQPLRAAHHRHAQAGLAPGTRRSRRPRRTA